MASEDNQQVHTENMENLEKTFFDQIQPYKEMGKKYLSVVFYYLKAYTVYRYKTYVLLAIALLFSLICVKIVYDFFMFSFPFFVAALILRYLVN